MKEKLNIAVVGCGYWGPNLIRNFHANPACRMKTICDLDSDRLDHLGELYPEINRETDFENLLADKELDAIAIATAVHLHYKLAKASLQAGKHTFIEKPMASSSEECQKLVSLAKAKGLILMVGHTFLYSPAIRKIKELVDRGELGEIRYISARRLNLGIFQKDLNVAWDLAPHDISIILHILGEMPETVNCQGTSHVTPGVEDVTSLTLQFKNRATAMIHSSWLDLNKVREMTIVGSKRMITYNDVEPQEKIKVFDAQIDRPPHYDTFGEFAFASSYGDRYIPHLTQQEPLKIETQHFLDCIKNGTQPLTSGENGLDIVRVLEASSQSLSQNGAPISLTQKTSPKKSTSAKKTANTAEIRKQSTI